MVIKNKYVKKYIPLMAMEQLIEEYKKKGYELKTQYPIYGTLRVDLFAANENDKLAIEFVDEFTTKESLIRLKQIAEEEKVTIKLINISKIRLEQKKHDTTKTHKSK